MKADPNKLFVVKKYIRARSAAEAIKKERSVSPDDVWIDEELKKGQAASLESAIGFHMDTDE